MHAIDKRKELLPYVRSTRISMYVLSTSCMLILARKTAYPFSTGRVVEQVS